MASTADAIATRRRSPQRPVAPVFVTAIAGLGPLVADELARTDGVRVEDAGFDGRADVLRLRVSTSERLLRLGTVEDVFVEVGRCQLAAGDDVRAVARRLWHPDRVGPALATWAALTGRRRRDLSYRVVARVLSERVFRRTDLRAALATAIRRDRPQWSFADPAQLELWALEYQPGRLVAGLRLSTTAMRQHGGRPVERPGSLRPTVAAAMIQLAGAVQLGGTVSPAGPAGGVLLDPCCGSGTILAEAAGAGWAAYGVDIDPEAVRIAARNVDDATVAVGDVRRLDWPDASVGACVTNLPFGRRYALDGDPKAWLRAVLTELTRVTRPGGRVVLLTPGRLPSVPGLTERRMVRIRLLGIWTRIVAYERNSPGQLE